MYLNFKDQNELIATAQAMSKGEARNYVLTEKARAEAYASIYVANVERFNASLDTMRRATEYGTESFEHLAAMTGKPIQVALWCEVRPFSDTLAVINGCTAITEQNLQYYPVLVRYYECD